MMASVPSRRYRFVLKFRPHRELDRLKARRRWDKKMNTVAWVCYKAMKIRWRKLCRQLTRSKKLEFTEMRDFFTVKVARHWHRLPREAVDAPSLEVFKARLDGAWSNLV